MARAISLALAVFTYQNTPNVQFRSLFQRADRFGDYILNGQWPKEAVEQIGKVKEGWVPRVWPEVQGDPQEDGFKEEVQVVRKHSI